MRDLQNMPEDFKRKQAQLNKLAKAIPKYIAGAAEKMKDANFSAQGFVSNGAAAKWPKRKKETAKTAGKRIYRRKFLENWGRGIGMMAEECKEAGLPAPEYKLGGGFVVLVFRYHNEGAAGQVTGQVSNLIPTKYRLSTDQVCVLLKILENKELSVSEIMEKLGMTHRPTFRTNYLRPTLNDGYIVPLYPNQPNHPRQKYRLTDKGKDLLDTLSKF